MSSLADQAAAIAAVAQTVPNVGRVYDYQPVPEQNDWARFVEMFTEELPTGVSRVRAVTVGYGGEERADRVIGGRRLLRQVYWIVRVWHGWWDRSEAEFRDLVEALAAAIDGDRTLGGTVLDHDPVRILLPNDGQGVLLGPVACHYAELRLTTRSEVVI